MNLTYNELLRVTEHSHTHNGQAGFIPFYAAKRETVLHMPQQEQDWWDAVRRRRSFAGGLRHERQREVLAEGGRMRQLYRQTYLRGGSPRSITFSAADAVSAAEFSELWEHLSGCPVLTLKPIGRSKIPEHPWTRRKLPQSELSRIMKLTARGV